MSHYVSVVNIPAYDASGKGLIIKFKLSIVPNSGFVIKTTGSVATALEKNLKRTIEIMASMKRSWESLESSAYHLECSHNQFAVKDAKSSSMALSIALINACSAISGKPQIPGLSGTGILRVDGSFDPAHLEEKKCLAAKHTIASLTKFITTEECKHLYDLEELINQYH